MSYPVQVSDSIWLTAQMLGLRRDGTQLISVCVKSDNGEFVAMEAITQHPDNTFSYKDKSIGIIGSEEFSKYLKKFQPSPVKPPARTPVDESELFASVSAIYKEIGSIKGAAKAFNISSEKARRILFTTGDYTCDTHEKIMALLKEGKTIEDAAASIGISRKKASAYLPYNR